MKKLLTTISLFIIFNLSVNAQSLSGDWVIIKDTIFGKINWDTDEMLSITQKKDSIMLLIEKKDIYIYQFKGNIKYGGARKPIIKENSTVINDSSLFRNLNDTSIYTKLMEHEKLLRDYKFRLDYLQSGDNYYYDEPGEYLRRAGNLGIAKNVILVVGAGITAGITSDKNTDKGVLLGVGGFFGLVYFILDMSVHQNIKMAGYAIEERKGFVTNVSKNGFGICYKF